jgi:hypothetical protein
VLLLGQYGILSRAEDLVYLGVVTSWATPSVLNGYRVSTQGPVIITPQAAPNLFTPNGTLESTELSHPRGPPLPELYDLHRSMNKVAV